MMTRRNLLAAAVLLTVMALTLRSVLHETHADDQYGMARIHLGAQTVYVKSRRCNVGCAPGIWLSRSSDRCRPPDPALDYSFHSEQIVYARQGEELLVAASPRAITNPTSGGWIDVHFVSPSGQAPTGTSLRAIMFGQHVPERDVPSEEVERNTCIRAFGHDWNWL